MAFTTYRPEPREELEIYALRAEIERLRVALRAIIEEDYGLQSPHQKKMAEIAKQALNEQLRESAVEIPKGTG